MTSAPIEFWFDFSSAYAYFASLEIEEVAAKHKRATLWRPFMLGAAFERTGAKGLSRTPLKKDYASHDWDRIARLRGVRFSLPPHHPSIALPAVRAFYQLERGNPEMAVPFAKTVFEHYFINGIDTGDPRAIGEVAAGLGLSATEIAAANDDPEMKALARRRSEEAVSRGIFGSPWIVADDEPFWGWDRVPMLDLWLERDGW